MLFLAQGESDPACAHLFKSSSPKSVGHLLDFTEQGQTSGYLRITQAQTHFLQDPNCLIKSISWDFQICFVPSSVTSSWPRHGAASSVQHPEQGWGVSASPGQSWWQSFCRGGSALAWQSLRGFNAIVVSWSEKDEDSPFMFVVNQELGT